MRDLSRNRQYLLGEEARRYLFASRRAGDPRRRGAFKSSESVIRSGLRYYMHTSYVYVCVCVFYIYIYIYIYIYMLVRTRKRERKRRTYRIRMHICIRGGHSAALCVTPKAIYRCLATNKRITQRGLLP